ncbi:MAG: zinc metallopeptidase [Clostridia bacterium]|jgi:Zn-dependent membrane protease YugP|nr:zinc metallopeptidase [Clostridia bacterium]MCI2013838.1 zinc metallopeptidase [Clostridia bacterium]
MFYLSFQYIWVLIPAMILAIYAQSKVKNTFARYSKVSNRRGITGAEAARALLQASGIYDVKIERVNGSLTDFYDPSHKVLKLSDPVYRSTSLSAVGVAAHETGHAVQHNVGYAPLMVRSAMVPLTSISSRLAMPFIIIGIILGSGRNYGMGGMLIQAGILLFSLAVLFSLVTLPVEFNASKRAVNMLYDYNILSQDEVEPVKKVLSAAAMTYVAAAASAIASLLRLILIFGGNRRR